MGNFCGKPPAIKYGGDEFQSQRERKLARGSSELYVPRGVSSRRQESFRVKKKSISGEIKFQLVDRKANGSRKVRDDYYEKNGVNSEVVNNYPGAGTIPKATEGEQVAAGWPSWLASAAGEAVKGWLPRKADTFEKLDKVIMVMDVHCWCFSACILFYFHPWRREKKKKEMFGKNFISISA